MIRIKNSIIRLEEVACMDLMGFSINVQFKSGLAQFIHFDTEQEAQEIFDSIPLDNNTKEK